MALTAAVRAQAIGQVTVDTQTNSACTVDLVATADIRHVIRAVIANYSINSGAEELTIAMTVGGSAVTITVGIPIAAVEPIHLRFERGELVGDDNTQVLFTLTAGAGGEVGYLNVIHE